MNELALFSGIGGGILASKLLGWTTIGACEIEEYPRRVLLQRQRDGILDRFPIWDDVRTFDGSPWRGLVDVISGGFPCQDISIAGGGGRGLAGERSGLWFEYLRIVREIRPRFVFAENSPHLRTRGLGICLEGLAELGYNARWCVLGARHFGACHKRDRMWVVAYSNSIRIQRSKHKLQKLSPEARKWHTSVCNTRWRKTDHLPAPFIFRAGDDLAFGMDRIKAIGNGQVPIVAASAFRILAGDLI